MSSESILTGKSPAVVIEAVYGELKLRGWDRSEVNAEASSGSQLTMTEVDGAVVLSSMSNCLVSVPKQARVRVNAAYGNMRMNALQEVGLEITQGSGNLSMRSVGGAQINTLSGNLVAKDIYGDLQVDNLYGNLLLRGVHGPVAVKIKANGSVNINLEPELGQSYLIEAFGDIYCELPDDANVEIELTSAAGDITIDLAQIELSINEPTHKMILGDGGALLRLSSQGSITLRAPHPSREHKEDFDLDVDTLGSINDSARMVADRLETQLEFLEQQLDDHLTYLSLTLDASGLSSDATERITQQAREKARRAARRAKRKVEVKLAAAQRKAARKAKTADRRAQDRRYRRPPVEVSPSPPETETVSDEERLMILEMLGQGQINAEEADQLLEALGDL